MRAYHSFLLLYKINYNYYLRSIVFIIYYLLYCNGSERIFTRYVRDTLVTGYWLLVTGYWLLVTGYWLLVTGYWLLVPL